MEQDFAFKDYYRILNIPPDAGIDDIRSAFRRLARQTHPDATKDPLNYENFILIREGYDVLSDKKKRAEYDAIWKAYYSNKNISPGSNAQTLADDFDISSNDAYKEEWEYFKLHPDDYLDLFQSSLKMFIATLLAVLTGITAPLAVFFAIVAGLFVLAVLLGIIAGAMVTTSLSSVVGIIFAIMAFRFIRKKASRWRKRGVMFLGKIAVYPLSGIPKKYGTNILYMNYAAVFTFLVFFGIRVVRWAAGLYAMEGFSGKMPNSEVFFMLFAAVCTVAIIAASLIIVYEIIIESLVRYPSLRYTRVRIRKGIQISYQTQKKIG